MAALVWYDLATKRRLQPATLWGASLIAAAVVITGVMAQRPVGAAFAYWFSGLAGTRF